MVYQCRYTGYALAANKDQVFTTYLPAQKDEFTEGSDAWEALNAGRQVTLDSKGFIVDVWDEATGIIYDILGEETGTRSVPYANTISYQNTTPPNLTQTPKFSTYFPEDKSKFTEGGDAWQALNAGNQITTDSKGFIIDIWNPTTGDILDVFGNVTGNRTVSFAQTQAPSAVGLPGITTKAKVVFFDTPIAVFDETDSQDSNERERVLDEEIPKGATGAILSLVVWANDELVETVQADISYSKLPSENALFVGMKPGDEGVSRCVPYGIVKFFDAENRTFLLSASKNGQDVRIKVILHGYVIPTDK